MTYKWKIPGLYSVDAQTAGEVLEEIYSKHGRMDPSDIVDESRPEGAVLHPCFEWRDDVAAEKWREQQARGICQCIVTKVDTLDGNQTETRAFVNVQRTYQPMEIVIRSAEKMDDLFATAMRELEAFKAKFSALSKLNPVFSAIDSLAKNAAGKEEFS